ncbi:Os04g0370100 [Oryza sativa Japonica Group]|uniref:Os04g0370100 protein n=1 Tax=Oryza sativa subsp. japonica TaxID=39947 RepID=C7J165_ORYSJ|nr:Os04g0370100 [Oryza sativa Japonica Group]|eukprot:NP_001173895.1 Os04g0370100 [Oryza sativa Japonica Group]
MAARHRWCLIGLSTPPTLVRKLWEISHPMLAKATMQSVSTPPIQQATSVGAKKDTKAILTLKVPTVVKILMNVNMERITLAMEIATINLEVSIVCVMRVVVEMRQFKEDAEKTSYHRKHDWQLVLLPVYWLSSLDS